MTISIHSPHTGRDTPLQFSAGFGRISIHSPHTGRDLSVSTDTLRNLLISIHSPHTGRDEGRQYNFAAKEGKFQSTLPTRGETPRRGLFSCWQHFNPLSPHGERLQNDLERVSALIFQSTLPTRGETDVLGHVFPSYDIFQSTLPTRGETLPSICMP